MGNAEINTINIILTLYKMMCNTNVLLAVSWFQPQPAGRRQRGMFERHTQYRLKSEQKKKKKKHKTFRDDVFFFVYPQVSGRSS